MTDRVLVTGGAGFIGSNVVEQLVNRNYNVTVLDNLSTGYKENIDGFKDIEFIEGDIRNKNLVSRLIKRVEGIFHLASIVGNIKSIENPLIDAEVNVLGTLNILNAAKEYKTKKIVCSSSGAIFGEVCYLPIDEKHPCEPDSPYGVTKLAMEKHSLCYSRLYDLDIVCLRYFNVYGINQRYDPYGNIIPIWTGNHLNKQPLIIYGDGEQTRDFIDVKDVALANILAYETPNVRGAFNIGTGKSITINYLSEIFQKISSEKNQIIRKPRRKGEVKDSEASIEKAKRIFNFEPKVDLATGIDEYIKWFSSLNGTSSDL